jgi:predicted dehydrogenase
MTAGTIRVGIIGLGRWGPNLLRNFQDHPASVVRIAADANEARRELIAPRYPSVGLSPTAEAVISSDVDAVAIATPTSTHYELVKQALLAGKHVLVEKPITDSVTQARELADLADERGLVLLVGHVFLYNPGVEAVKGYLDQDVLGRVYYVSMVRTNLGPIRTDVDVAWDLAAHDISIANYWLGTVPDEVSANGGAWINGDIADAVFMTLRYPRHVLVNIQASWLNPRKVRDITVVAEHKMLTLDDTNPDEPIRIYDKGVLDETAHDGVIDTISSFRSIVHDGEIRIPPVSLGEPLKAECAHFLDCVANGTKPRTGAHAAIDVVSALEAASRSMRANGRYEPVTNL